MKNKTIVSVALVLAAFASASYSAFAGQEDDTSPSSSSFDGAPLVPAEAGLSSSCVKQIERATEKKCNVDTKAAEGKDRMHPCVALDSSLTTNDEKSAAFDLVYIVGDADEWGYNVTVSDKATCEFTFVSDGQ